VKRGPQTEIGEKGGSENGAGRTGSLQSLHVEGPQPDGAPQAGAESALVLVLAKAESSRRTCLLPHSGQANAVESAPMRWSRENMASQAEQRYS